MATKTTEERRSQPEPLEEAQEALVGGDGSLKRAAMTAAAAAIAGGLAGAAQELLSRRGEHDEAVGEDGEPQAEADEQEHAEEDERDEPSAEAEEDNAVEDDEEGDAEDEELDADGNENEEPHAEADARGDADVEPGQGSAPGNGGAPPGRATELVRAARRQIEELIGETPESVSGVRRTDGGWAVSFEVVEVRRIPETTDVLSSYEVTVDDDGNLLDLERRRRYRRSQVDDS
jgi:hypothetical protein